MKVNISGAFGTLRLFCIQLDKLFNLQVLKDGLNFVTMHMNLIFTPFFLFSQKYMHTCIYTHTVSLVCNFGSKVSASLWKKPNLSDVLRFYFHFR